MGPEPSRAARQLLVERELHHRARSVDVRRIVRTHLEVAVAAQVVRKEADAQLQGDDRNGVDHQVDLGVLDLPRRRQEASRQRREHVGVDAHPAEVRLLLADDVDERSGHVAPIGKPRMGHDGVEVDKSLDAARLGVEEEVVELGVAVDGNGPDAGDTITYGFAVTNGSVALDICMRVPGFMNEGQLGLICRSNRTNQNVRPSDHLAIPRNFAALPNRAACRVITAAVDPARPALFLEAVPSVCPAPAVRRLFAPGSIH